MKRLFAAVLILLMAVSPCLAGNNSTRGDVDYWYVHIAYAFYDGEELFGWVEIPDGDLFFVRATFFLPGEISFIVIVPLDCAGFFALDIATPCESAEISVVDSPCALNPANGIFYDSAPVEITEPIS